MGRLAAKVLARELAKSCSGLECALPANLTTVTRQGLTATAAAATLDMLREGWTGIPEVDLFLTAVRKGRRRRGSVLSPDIKKPVRHTVGPSGS
jgi:hypothetical protein